jgi:diadenosine tetraphosphate (Ap4A) HIT family hydrolase
MKLLETKLNAEGFHVSQNNGTAQDVKHYHVHIMPKFRHDNKMQDVKIIYRN